jgi:uncharacterized membrane protein
MYAMVGFFGFGLANFFWKVAAANNTYGPSYIVVEGLAFTIVGVLTHILHRHQFELPAKITSLAVLGGILAAISVLLVLLAFRAGGEGSIVFPIARLGVLVTVVLTIVVYREPLTTTKILGLAFGVTSIAFLSR